ncbi:FtsQ-type POTRA domain-containing protein [Corynebacterium felinum]|uniref:Cell division protein FtsQ n=1 Tax=Corynebacterium felinum TaxID=131318 RepID=A0ABU2BFI5_9CORY|nr:FtsQ-type POTRA domain-containing protein [Corynebacterium felinum]MDF5820924.1 FtsQ-type POTRA domain-containing protein [Corynebacterium felinum]MDR7356134.1 cell division protein FtsQ [Corynebacterium felinum]WJY95468.1 Cell division protein FtsQ [Corynebacterium felinum]
MAKKIVITALICVLVGAAAFAGAYFYPVLKVQEVVATGQQSTTEEEINAVTAELEGQNLLRVNTEEIARKTSALPWVAKAKVSTKLPNQVVIDIQEHQAVLYAPREDGDHLIDTNGKVFVIDQHPEGAVAVTGTREDDERMYSDIISVLAALGDHNRVHIKEIKAQKAEALSLVLHDGREVYWGSKENSHDKAVAFGVALSRGEQRLDISGAPVIAVR